MGNIVVESKKYGTLVELTHEQWDNMKRSGHDKAWKVVSTEALMPKEEINIQPVDLSSIEQTEETYLDVEFNVDYKKLLDDAGVKFNHRISDPYKLKAIWDQFQKNDDLGT